MKYSSNLVKKEREQIFKLFTDHTKLKFNEIEKALKIRSNMVSYHLEKMQEDSLIKKKEKYYYLTKSAERYLPIIPYITGEKMGPLPVILIALVNKDKILLIKRKNRPYKDYWALIGGKMHLEESFEKASIRQVREKTSLDAKFTSINSVLHERVKDKDIVKHSFILFFTRLTTKESEFKESNQGKLKWFKINEVEKERIIPSDLWLIKNKLKSKIDVKSAHMLEKQEELSSFRILK